MQARRRPTMAEIRATVPERTGELEAESEAGVRPGRFNLAGELFDPDGVLLTLKTPGATAREALRRIRLGAQVAEEGCGCGGFGGCNPTWTTSAAWAGVHRLVEPRKTATPTWIDLWSGPSGDVVFLHGDMTADRDR